MPSFFVIFVVLAALLQAPVAAETPSFQEIEESLTCQCGCGLTVHSCNHLQCPSALPLREEIRAQITTGAGKDDILLHFAEKYGEKILSSPTTSGFNLTAWVIPFFAVGTGGLLIVMMLRRWQHRTTARAQSSAAPAGTPAVRKFEDVLDRELDEFDR